MRRNLMLILLFVLIGCKTETKTENQIDQSVYEMWNDFAESNPEFKQEELPDSWYFHNNKEDANRLAELTLKGKKKASSGLYAWYEEANADLPKIGTKHIITDFEGKAQAIIEIKRVDTIPFNEITRDYAALDIGTKIEPLKKWKKAHWGFFTNALEQSGGKPTEEMLVVCETFEIIWTKYGNRDLTRQETVSKYYQARDLGDYNKLKTVVNDSITITAGDYIMQYNLNSFYEQFKWDSVFKPSYRIVKLEENNNQIVASVALSSIRNKFLKNSEMTCQYRISFNSRKISKIEELECRDADWAIWSQEVDSLVSWIKDNHPELDGFAHDMTMKGAMNYLKAIELYEANGKVLK